MKWVIGSVAFLGLVLYASAKGKASPTFTVLEEETPPFIANDNKAQKRREKEAVKHSFNQGKCKCKSSRKRC